jgi:predicted RecB family nuclease
MIGAGSGGRAGRHPSDGCRRGPYSGFLFHCYSRAEKKGIFTVTQLSYLIRPRRRKAKRRGGKGFKVELQAYALRTGKTFLQAAPQLTRSRQELFIDVESIPDEDFCYLVGLMVLDGEATSYFSFWADCRLDEKGMWAGAFEKIRQYPGASVYPLFRTSPPLFL